MKTRIVLWGTNHEEKKVLLGLELKEDENTVNVNVIPEDKATEDFYKQMMGTWRDGGEITFPDEVNTLERPLSITEDILPENIRVERTDIVNRAKTEWHFVVLSSKLYKLYKTELEDLKTRIEGLTKYEGALWEEMKGFWSKVQDQSREKNLFREHANELKKETNNLFETMKGLRKKLDQEFKKVSTETLTSFMTKLNDVEEKIEKGLGLKPLFEELKNLQQEFKGLDFTRDDRSKAWKKLDNAFKNIKEKKYGSAGNTGRETGLQRVQRRYNGLISAIQKMERSINKDKSDLDYQAKKANESEGQLEQQIRQAKIVMMKDRVSSKELKLADMHKTKVELEAKIKQEEKREEKRKEKEEIEKTKEKVKEKIASEIKAKSDALEGDKEKLEKSASAISSKKAKPKEDQSLIAAITATVGDAIEDVVDTVKAAAEVVGEKVEETIESITSEEE